MAKEKDDLDPQLAKLSFEDSLKALETTINRIEQGDIGLEDSLAAYKQGEQLIKRCRALLFDAEQRVKTIRLDEIPLEGEDPGTT
jgi:exodeoxyribonuclease VII small subunit